MMIVILPLSLMALANAHLATTTDPRDAEFARIKRYELIYFNDTQLIESNNLFEFDVFGQHYKIKLIRNDDMHVINIRHPSINSTKLHQHFSKRRLAQSCHYFGKVINTKQPSKTQVSLSFCDNAGIRGRIVAFDDIIIITPSAYFLDKKKDSKYSHKLDDEHLIYKVSDFDMDDIIGKDGIINLHHNQYAISKQQKTKRRTLYNGGSQTLEFLAVVGPDRTQAFQSYYPSSWYTALYDDCANLINTLSTGYSATEWGTDVGPIAIKFVELEIIPSFTGIYTSLTPTYTTSISIDGPAYLRQFSSWLSQYKTSSTFDNAQLLSNIRFADGYTGWAYTGTVCKGATSAGIDYMLYGFEYSIRNTAHEMGHNFGMNHDGSGNDCHTNDGLMGYGTGQGFSECSIEELNTYFANNDGLTCLGTGWYEGDFTSNYGSGTAPQPTPVASPTPPPTSVTTTTWQCMNVRNLDLTQYNGYWTYKGNHALKPYYQKDLMYIYLDESSDRYYMGPTVGGASAYGYCGYNNIQYCNGMFILWNNAWVTQTSSGFSQVSSTYCTSDAGSCSGYDCVQMSLMPVTVYGNFNGFGILRDVIMDRFIILQRLRLLLSYIIVHSIINGLFPRN